MLKYALVHTSILQVPYCRGTPNETLSQVGPTDFYKVTFFSRLQRENSDKTHTASSDLFEIHLTAILPLFKPFGLESGLQKPLLVISYISPIPHSKKIRTYIKESYECIPPFFV